MRKGEKRLISKVGAAIMAAAMIMAQGMPAMAATYDAAIGGTLTTTFDKYLVMDKQANVPNVSFTYAITAGTAKDYSLEPDQRKVAVMAGVDADKVTMAGVGTETAKTITYKAGDTTANDANTMVKDYDSTTEKYAKKTATLDFSACKFTEPGIYRYVVTESGTNQAITNDADLTRIVDVYVDSSIDGESGVKKLSVAGYVLHSNADDNPDVPMGDNNGSGGAYGETKSQGFTNSYDTSDVTISKNVSGNQASHDKYFEFTVNIKDAVAGTVYDVDITKADATIVDNAATTYTGKTNPTSITVGADGTVTEKFYLHHGQEVKIQGIAKDTKYTVTETKEDYKPSVQVDAAAVINSDTTPEQTIASDDMKVAYTNTRQGAVPTGVIMTVAPFAAITLLGGFGAAKIIAKKKKEDEEE